MYMARKDKKTNEIVGSLDPKYLVQKSDPLVLMRSVPFSLGELKILDTYISRINASDDTRRTVIFTKEEYEELMGLTCANYRALEKHTKGMLGKVVELEMPNEEYLQFVLFEQARYRKDEYGKPIIELTCTSTAKDLFFCIGKYHYFSYALENVIKLTRKASYLLYIYIRINRYRNKWDIDLNELRDSVLDCKGQESYQEYKIFKRDVLAPAVEEINKKTDCQFTYEAIKRGRKVAKIKFIYQNQDKIEGQTSFFDELSTAPIMPDQCEVDDEVMDRKDIISQLREVCSYDFTREAIQSVYNFAKTFVHDKAIKVYFEQTYLKLLEVEKKSKIRNRFRYFYQMICNDADRQRKEQQDREQTTGYPATYDIAEYESTSVLDDFDD